METLQPPRTADDNVRRVAPAGTLASAIPSAKPTADTIFERRFIPFSSIAALPPFNNANSPRARQNNCAGEADEQPVLDNARY